MKFGNLFVSVLLCSLLLLADGARLKLDNASGLPTASPTRSPKTGILNSKPPLPTWPVTEALETTPLGFINGPLPEHLGCGFEKPTYKLNHRMRDALKAINAASSRLRAKINLTKIEMEECAKQAKPVWNFEHGRQKLKNALLSPPYSPRRNFTVVFGGTSVTTGRECKYNESYPFAFERFASCAFSAAGLNLKVQNAAHGFNHGLSYGMCVSAHYESKADMVFWEMVGIGGADPWGYSDEVAMRNFFSAKLFPHSPIFVLMQGMVSMYGENKLPDLMTEECWKDCPYKTFWHSHLCPVEKCKYVPCKECAQKFKNSGFPSGPRKSLLEYYKKHGTGAIAPLNCIGPRADMWTFSDAKMTHVAKQPTYRMPVHPGPYGHEMMGMIIAYIILAELEEAIKEINKEMPQTLRGTASQIWSDRVSVNLNMSIALENKPLLCPSWLCKTSFSCATTLEPHVPLHFDALSPSTYHVNSSTPDLPAEGVLVSRGSDSLLGWSKLLAEGSSPLYDMRDYCSIQSHCPKRLSTGSMFSIQQIHNATNRGIWVAALMEFSRSAVAKESSYQNGYTDRKYAIMGSSQSGWLKLRFFGTSRANFLVLCEAALSWPDDWSRRQANKKNARVQLQDSKSVEYQLDGVTMPRLSLYRPRKNGGENDIFAQATNCVKLEKKYGNMRGEHILGVRVKVPDRFLMLTLLAWK